MICNVGVTHQTGVEMEALTGAAAAALTVYDMCKALSHDIEIGPVRLLSKSGAGATTSAGSARDRARCTGCCSPAGAASAWAATRPPSTSADAASSNGHWALLDPLVAKTFVSVRADQSGEPLRARHAQIVDRGDIEGPAAGIRAAQLAHPQAAWLVVACDLPLLDVSTLQHLIARRDPSRLATAFRSRHDGLPEPLCAIYEPAAGTALQEFLATGRNCPRKS